MEGWGVPGPQKARHLLLLPGVQNSGILQPVYTKMATPAGGSITTTPPTTTVTFCTDGYVPYVQNLWASLGSPTSGFFALCWEPEAAAALAAAGVPHQVVPLGAAPPETAAGTIYEWGGGKVFSDVMFAKLDALRAFLAQHAHDAGPVLYLDGDVVGLQPDAVSRLTHSFLAGRGTEWDIVFQCDEGHTGPCAGQRCPNMCAGVMLLDNSEVVRRALDYHAFLQPGEQYALQTDDQSYLNILARQGVFRCATFDRSLCCNGVLRACVPAAALLLHYNYLIGPQKLDSMAANGHLFGELFRMSAQGTGLQGHWQCAGRCS